jgi:hypothetical protein
MRAHAPATAASSYCRSTSNARITAGEPPPGTGTSNPPRPNATDRSDANGVRPARTSASCASAVRT